MPGRPRSRPMPLSLMPPVGACWPPMNQPLIQTEPASSRWASLQGARDVAGVDAGDEAVAEAVGESRAPRLCVERSATATGPKTSSRGNAGLPDRRGSKIVGATK